MLDKAVIKERINQHKSHIKELGIDFIGLFGSYVRDEQQEGSDIDLLISFEKDKETFNNFMAICYLLEEIFEGERVEVVTKNGLSPYIGPKILNEVEYVQIAA
ncbi:MAG: nucleotidyltransferase family protein [Saprospiraceae bacterium]|nr:nucleotidyltransferase family protein [Saprospiraceae bacterium]